MGRVLMWGPSDEHKALRTIGKEPPIEPWPAHRSDPGRPLTRACSPDRSHFSLRRKHFSRDLQNMPPQNVASFYFENATVLINICNVEPKGEIPAELQSRV